MLIRGGANIYHVKELLGHEDLQMLKYYTRLPSPTSGRPTLNVTRVSWIDPGSVRMSRPPSEGEGERKLWTCISSCNKVQYG